MRCPLAEVGMASLLQLTALRHLNLTDCLEMTPGRLAQLTALSGLTSLCMRDCYELRVRPLCLPAPFALSQN